MSYDGTTTTIPNEFNLSTRVIETTVAEEGAAANATDKVIMQLLSHKPGGEMEIQYYGTKARMHIHLHCTLTYSDMYMYTCELSCHSTWRLQYFHFYFYFEILFEIDRLGSRAVRA